MKTKLIFFGLLCFNLSFGQNSLSLGALNPLIPVAANEIFRFQPGNVTQLDSGSSFGVGSSDRWFSIGKVQTGANLAYGLRFQAGDKAVTFGYQNVNSINPRIQWIGTGASLGNLEFRVADSFNSTVSTLVATMTKDGSTIFGATAASGTNVRVSVVNNGGNSVNLPPALESVTGVSSFASNGVTSTIGVVGSVSANADFSAGIFGVASPNLGDRWAGYFDGRVYGTTFIKPSDERLKSNIRQEKGFLEKIASLRAVTYDYNKIEALNLPEGTQHGFIAQELEKVFPEMITEVNKPVFDREGKIKSQFAYKAVDYMGLISVLTGGIQELNKELKLVKEEIAVLKEQKSERKQISPAENIKGAFINQNIPNPFVDQTTISYQLPEGTTTAEIMVFDLNGRLIKNYPINKNQSELTIKASEIGSGLFIYSLVQNGQELLSKKMVVK